VFCRCFERLHLHLVSVEDEIGLSEAEVIDICVVGFMGYL
jgi:hypothetical protein